MSHLFFCTNNELITSCFYLSLSRRSFNKKIDNAYCSIEKIFLNEFFIFFLFYTFIYSDDIMVIHFLCPRVLTYEWYQFICMCIDTQRCILIVLSLLIVYLTGEMMRSSNIKINMQRRYTSSRRFLHETICSNDYHI